MHIKIQHLFAFLLVYKPFSDRQPYPTKFAPSVLLGAPLKEPARSWRQIHFVAGPGIGRRSGRELGEAMSLGRWRGLGANPQHAGGGGGRGILLAGQLVTSVGRLGLTRRRPGTHLEEALRVGTWPPPPPAPALRNPPPPPPPAALDEAALAMMLHPVRLRQEELEQEICSICHSFLRYGRATCLVPFGHAFHIECVRYNNWNYY